MDELILKMDQAMTLAIVEAGKFKAGNKTAGTRLRAKMQEIKTLAQEVRTLVSEVKNRD